MKKKSTSVLLCFLLGAVGGHQFYLGKTGKGILYIFTFGLFGIGSLIDLIVLLTMSDEAFNVKYNNGSMNAADHLS